MCTKFFSDDEVHKYFNPYENPYEAFINYMNVLNDFSLRLDKVAPPDEVDKEIKVLKKIIEEKEKKLHKYEAELKTLQSKKKAKTRKKAAGKK
jgi:alpha-amylase